MPVVSSIRRPSENRMPLPISSYQTRGGRGGVERLINCRPEQGRQKGEIYLYGIHGQTLKGTFPRSPQRGAIRFQNRLHVVVGNRLYRVDSSGHTELGEVPGLNSVSMAENGAQLVILADGAGYVWDAVTVTPITDPDFRTASDVTFVGNYLLFTEKGSGRFFGGELGSAVDYDALDFATAETNTDDLAGIAENHGDVFLAGTHSCEIWGNVGGSGFPFARRFNGSIEQGCGAGQSIVGADQTLFWIDETRLARRLNGVTPVRISTHAVETAWEDYSTIADAEGYTYTRGGHIIVGFNFPTVGATWEYDVTTKQWNERDSYLTDGWRSRWVVEIYGGVWVGDRASGKYGVIDKATFNEFGDPQVMSWTYPAIWGESDTVFHHEMQVVCETGVGLNNQSGPEIMMEVSDDGGRDFDHLEVADMGKIGKHRTLLTWTGLGSSEDRVYRGSISDDSSERAIYQSYLRATGGTF